MPVFYGKGNDLYKFLFYRQSSKLLAVNEIGFYQHHNPNYRIDLSVKDKWPNDPQSFVHYKSIRQSNHACLSKK